MRRVILVTGPPCAGKTTHVQRHAQPGDLILDQDQLGRAAMTTALAHVAAMTDGTAWVIRCAPGPHARTHLAQQIRATEHVHIVEPEPVLTARAAHRPQPRRHISAVRSWFAREQADQLPRPRTTAARAKGTTTQRGYGYSHQQARDRAVRDMEDGQPCVRCGGPLYRSMGKRLHLDHNEDRTGYRGLAHGTCNEQAGGRARHAKAKATRKPSEPTPHSRRW